MTIMIIPNNPLVTGWIDPYGKFYPCEPGQHLTKARALAEEYNYSQAMTEKRFILNFDDLLFLNGWVKIGYSKRFLCHESFWRIDWSRYHILTYEKKRVLEPYFDNEKVDQKSRKRWEEEK